MNLKTKSFILIMLFALIVLFNFNIVYAAGSFTVTGGGSIDVGKTTTISINTSNCAGKFSIKSSDSSKATVSSSSAFVDGSEKITITGKAAGTVQITVTPEDVTDTDENPVTGSKAITVVVVAPAPAPTPEPEPEPTPAPTPTPAPSTPEPEQKPETKPTEPEKPAETTKPTETPKTETPVVETKSSNAKLKNLGIRPNDFSGFKDYIMVYNHEVPNSVDKIEIYAEKADPKAKIVSGVGNKNLSVGSNSFDIKVEAEDGTTKVYTLNITREEEIIGLSALSISGLELSPKFDSEKYSYTVKLTEDLDKLQIQTTPTIKNSKIEIKGNENLQSGENIIEILVTHADTEEIAKYEIKVDKEVEENDEETDLQNEVTIENTTKVDNTVKNTVTEEKDITDNVNSTKPILRTVMIVFAIVFVIAIIVISYIIKKDEINEFDFSNRVSSDIEKQHSKRDNSSGGRGKHS